MPNFFEDILDKYAVQAIKPKAEPRPAAPAPAAVQERPQTEKIGGSFAGNFFSDIVQNFKPAEIVKAPTEKPGPMEVTESDKEKTRKLIEGVKSFARTFPREGAGAAIEAIERITGQRGLEITPGAGEVLPKEKYGELGSKVERFLFGDKPVRSLSEQGKETLKSFGVPEESAGNFGLTAGAVFLGLDLLPPTKWVKGLLKSAQAVAEGASLKRPRSFSDISEPRSASSFFKSVGDQAKDSLSKISTEPSAFMRKIDPEDTKYLKLDEAASVIKTLYNNAEKNVKELAEVLKSNGVKGLSVRVKTPESIGEKIVRKAKMGRNFLEAPNDVVAGTIVVKDEKAARKLVKDLGEKVSKYDDYFNNPTNGYRGINADLKMSDGSLAELQIHTRQTLDEVENLHAEYDNIVKKAQAAKGTKEVGAAPKEGNFFDDIRRTYKPAPAEEAIGKIQGPTRKAVENVPQQIKTELEQNIGRPLTHEEVVQAAKESSILTRAYSREAVKRSEAALLRTRQHLAALAKDNKLTKDFVDALKIVRQEASRRGRELNALGIEATPELGNVKAQIVKKLIDLGMETEKIIKAADGVNFEDAAQVAEFYRKFVKPTLPEIIDEYRYINLLSSPKTHIVNAFSNLLQATVLKPATMLASGAIDWVGSGLTGAARKHYVSEVPAYARGAFSSVGDAFSQAFKVIRGQQQIYRPDVTHLPTRVRILAPFQFVPRVLEASDVFFRSIIRGGEIEAGAKEILKAGGKLDDAAKLRIAEKADREAAYYVFRQALDPSNKEGQGTLLSAIDKMTATVYKMRDVPGVKWFIPFVATPMNILKQGIEYSPLGVLTAIKSADKAEQVAKAFIGSTVMAGAAFIAAKGDSTWAAPPSGKERDYFYASGKQPYSLRIGDKWFSYSRLGPLAYPIAMAAAIRHYTTQDPQRIGRDKLETLSRIFGGVSKFFSDQSYMEGIGDFVDAAQGDPYGLGQALSNVPGQLVPLASLQRWIATLIDPIYRKPGTGVSVEAIVQNLEKGIPGLSKKLPAYKEPFGDESTRQLRFLNALSPIGVTKERSEYSDILEAIRAKKEATAGARSEKEKILKELGL